MACADVRSWVTNGLGAARRSLERSLVSLRSLLAALDLSDELRLEATVTLHSFWNA
jgi:hypothetical protein